MANELASHHRVLVGLILSVMLFKWESNDKGYPKLTFKLQNESSNFRSTANLYFYFNCFGGHLDFYLTNFYIFSPVVLSSVLLHLTDS